MTTYEVGATASTAEVFQSTRFLSYFVISAAVVVLVLVPESRRIEDELRSRRRRTTYEVGATPLGRDRFFLSLPILQPECWQMILIIPQKSLLVSCLFFQ